MIFGYVIQASQVIKYRCISLTWFESWVFIESVRIYTANFEIIVSELATAITIRARQSSIAKYPP